MPVVVVNGDSDFNKKFAAANGKPVFIDFTASWCGPCKMIGPVFDELANQYKSAVFLKVDVDECSGTAASYGVNAMPTFFAFVNGQKKETIQGANADGLRAMVKKYASNVAWTGTGQRLSSAPSAGSSTAGPSPRVAPATMNNGFDPLSMVLNTLLAANAKLRELGLSDFNAFGFIVQPVHLVLALGLFFFLGPFGLFITAGIIFMSQPSDNAAQGATNNPFGNPPNARTGQDRQQPSTSAGPRPFGGSGQRLGGN